MIPIKTSDKPSVLRSIIEFFKSLWAKLFSRKSSEKPTSAGIRPLPPIGKDLAHADWTRQDTMVGTVRTKEQLTYNLSQRCYYVPARFLPKTQLPITYIALHERDDRDIPCIRRWAQVLTTEVVERGTIPVTMRSGSDPKESYYYFTVKEWLDLPHRIEIIDTPRGKPLFTHSFLLPHCHSSYALFSVESPEDFRLLNAVYTLLEKDSCSQNSQNPVFSTETSHRLSLTHKALLITTSRGEQLENIPVSLWKESPRKAFSAIKKSTNSL